MATSSLLRFGKSCRDDLHAISAHREGDTKEHRFDAGSDVT